MTSNSWSFISWYVPALGNTECMLIQCTILQKEVRDLDLNSSFFSSKNFLMIMLFLRPMMSNHSSYCLLPSASTPKRSAKSCFDIRISFSFKVVFKVKLLLSTTATTKMLGLDNHSSHLSWILMNNNRCKLSMFS